jgi:hypothetical protein
VHVDAPTALYVFSLHGPHEVMREAALSALDLNVPAKHSVQVTPTPPQLPLLHLQEETVVLLAGETVLIGHLVQSPPNDP